MESRIRDVGPQRRLPVPPLPALSTKPAVFSVDDTAIQIHWGHLPAGLIEVRANPSHSIATLDHPGGAGAVTVTGLRPHTSYRLELVVRQGDRASIRAVLDTATAPAGPGPELYRFATVNDLHLGRERFGILSTMREHQPTATHPERCVNAALDEAVAWGAERVVVKGDITDDGSDLGWNMARDAFARLDVPTDLVCGNHDVVFTGARDPVDAASRRGLRLHTGVDVLDVPGLRIVLMDSSVPGIDTGRWAPHCDAVCDAVADAPVAMVLTHHQPQPLRVPVYLPAGIPSPEAAAFAARVASANANVVGSSGHTHRNRIRRLGSLTWSEVGSTKDYPGVWCGYVVHEGGVRHVVRRIERHDCIQWTEYTRRAAGGAWGIWAPGRLDDRSALHPMGRRHVSGGSPGGASFSGAETPPTATVRGGTSS